MVAGAKKNQNGLNLFLNNYFNIIMVLVVIIVFIVSYIVVIKPKYDATMTAIESNNAQQQQLFDEQQKKLNNLKTISDLYNKIPATDLKKFNGVLPDVYVKEKLFGELDEIITKNGFLLNSIDIAKDAAANPGEPVKEVSPNVGSIKITLSLSAVNYSGFKNLIKLLENNLRLFDITEVSFSPSSNSTTFTLTTYYFKK